MIILDEVEGYGVKIGCTTVSKQQDFSESLVQSLVNCQISPLIDNKMTFQSIVFAEKFSPANHQHAL
jgi:hypothetical protein